MKTWVEVKHDVETVTIGNLKTGQLAIVVMGSVPDRITSGDIVLCDDIEKLVCHTRTVAVIKNNGDSHITYLHVGSFNIIRVRPLKPGDKFTVRLFS